MTHVDFFYAWRPIGKGKSKNLWSKALSQTNHQISKHSDGLFKNEKNRRHSKSGAINIFFLKKKSFFFVFFLSKTKKKLENSRLPFDACRAFGPLAQQVPFCHAVQPTHLVASWRHLKSKASTGFKRRRAGSFTPPCWVGGSDYNSFLFQAS